MTRPIGDVCAALYEPDEGARDLLGNQGRLKDALPPYSIGGMVRTQATMASTSPSVILLK